CSRFFVSCILLSIVVVLCFSLLFLYSFIYHRVLHSFPTRRSSDLLPRPLRARRTPRPPRAGRRGGRELVLGDGARPPATRAAQDLVCLVARGLSPRRRASRLRVDGVVAVVGAGARAAGVRGVHAGRLLRLLLRPLRNRGRPRRVAGPPHPGLVPVVPLLAALRPLGGLPAWPAPPAHHTGPARRPRRRRARRRGGRAARGPGAGGGRQGGAPGLGVDGQERGRPPARARRAQRRDPGGRPRAVAARAIAEEERK